MGNCLSWPILQSHHIKPDNVKIPGLSVNQVVTSNNRPPANQKGMENWRNYSAASTLIIFNIQELKTITDNFKTENLLGRGGFGNVYKGLIPENLRPGVQAMEVAVKVHSGEKSSQGHSEWLAEVNILGQFSHQNLVKLIGYCCENDHRVLVYEYMALGNAEYLLFSRAIDPLPWAIRMKIAYHAAKGLAFLHESEKPVIYRDFKTSNILLDMNHNAKLSDFGLAKDGPVGDDSHVSTRVMGTYGYAAPEYVKTGHLAASSDVYSFGVVLLELITGLKSLDKSRPPEQHELLNWAYPLLNQKKKLLSIIDRRLEGKYPLRSVLKTAMLAFHCLNENPKARPLMRDVVDTLEPLQEPEDIPESFKM